MAWYKCLCGLGNDLSFIPDNCGIVQIGTYGKDSSYAPNINCKLSNKKELLIMCGWLEGGRSVNTISSDNVSISTIKEQESIYYSTLGIYGLGGKIGMPFSATTSSNIPYSNIVRCICYNDFPQYISSVASNTISEQIQENGKLLLVLSGWKEGVAPTITANCPSGVSAIKIFDSKDDISYHILEQTAMYLFKGQSGNVCSLTSNCSASYAAGIALSI